MARIKVWEETTKKPISLIGKAAGTCWGKIVSGKAEADVLFFKVLARQGAHSLIFAEKRAPYSEKIKIAGLLFGSLAILLLCQLAA